MGNGNRPGTDDEDFLDVRPVRHPLLSSNPLPSLSSRAPSFRFGIPFSLAAHFTACHPERSEGSALPLLVSPYQSAARSSHAGLRSLISAIFFSRRQALISFSRAMALRT